MSEIWCPIGGGWHMVWTHYDNLDRWDVWVQRRPNLGPVWDSRHVRRWTLHHWQKAHPN